MAREGFASRLGFILVSAGCAIGIGNVWKFPYVAGQNGGAIFVLMYLLFLVIMGIPILSMELAVGRGGGSTCVNAFRRLEPSGSRWHLYGYVCLAGCYLLMMYYSTVSGWMMAYFFKFASGVFSVSEQGSEAEMFSELLSDPLQNLTFTVAVIVLGFAVLLFGVQKGLERVTKIMMTGLLGLILILAVNSLTLDKASEGISFYLLPDWKKVWEIGFFKVITSAMTQAFFTLSLGIGAMEIFGSYMSRDYTLGGESVKICALDTFVAIVSGLIIFPACFTYDIEPEQGPSLIFITLPHIFANMPYGRIWGSMFFLFMTFASFSTITAVFENLVVSLMDNLGWSRKKSVLINMIIVITGSLPCVFGTNLLKGMTFIGNRDVLDSEDFIVSSILLPLGSLVFLLFCVLKKGWGYKGFLKEANTGKGITFSTGARIYLTFILPVLILILFIVGIVPTT
ncbi:neurotransmitter:Na+ symporter, NSS family [Ruminococcaceae bacterium YRB3002]|nr:neurotransmitter:Na+ symporter, NSS family [Ruminococcaceae bacterium YRB3002]